MQIPIIRILEDAISVRRLFDISGRRPYAICLFLAVAGGLAVYFRLVDLGARDLWTDEAWVALAALKPHPGQALAAGQSTPPLYLLSVWALAQVFGGSEAVLRSISFLSGLGTLLVCWPLARRLAPLPAALLGWAMVAFSPIMVYYAKELKQYSGDAFFAVLLFWLAERCREHPGTRAWGVLALAGILALGFSHTSVFILPVVLAVLWFSLPRKRLRVFSLSVIWAGAFAAAYLLVLRRQVDPFLLSYWAQDFPDFSGPKAFAAWLWAAWHRYFWYFLGERGLIWGLPFLPVGIWVLWRQGARRSLVYFGGPILLAFAAAALHRYPFMAHYGGNRLMLFSAPLLYLLVAAGLAGVLAWLWRRLRGVPSLALAALVLVLMQPVGIIRENLYPMNNREEIEPLVDYLEQHRQPQDWIYVYYFANDPFRYYFSGSPQRVCWGKSCGETDLELPGRNTSRPQRLWLIASHINTLAEMREFAADLLGGHWQETTCLIREGALLFQFERRGPILASKGRGARTESDE